MNPTCSQIKLEFKNERRKSSAKNFGKIKEDKKRTKILYLHI